MPVSQSAEPVGARLSSLKFLNSPALGVLLFLLFSYRPLLSSQQPSLDITTRQRRISAVANEIALRHQIQRHHLPFRSLVIPMLQHIG
ncbi:hypothetical protein AF70_00041410 [Pseudomonas sp. KD5]|jgi:hypothetical protein|uniref:Uncharacterized protein n=1 Tax=Pseudomonas umsongensis TaxID=198618 RepID=A0ACC5MEJ4_9PSED|nr:hypothetical protein [Pseudomonas umsongensis]NMN78563.1 hypothetical protein [Pseudomonas sp. KD5]CAH0173397.1 hypothetical protein SRABI123_01253 [Pseudomonas sp. Bi123]